MAMYDNEFGTAKKAQNTLSVEYCHYHKVSDVKQQSIQFLMLASHHILSITYFPVHVKIYKI